MTEKVKKIGYAGSTIIEIVDWRTPNESNRVSLQRLRIELDPVIFVSVNTRAAR